MSKLIYSSLNWEDYIDDTREYLIEMNGTATETEVTEQAMEMCQNDWNDFYAPILSEYFDAHKCLAFGSIGRWNGTSYGGDVIESSDDFFQLLEDCEYFEIFADDDGVQIDGIHHDGRNSINIRELTDKGYEWYRDYADEHTDAEILDYLKTCFCSCRPSIEWCL